MDLTTVILQAASQAGVHTAAMPDIVARGQAVFANTTPDALAVQQWVFGLRTQAPHLFGEVPPVAAQRAREPERLRRGQRRNGGPPRCPSAPRKWPRWRSCRPRRGSQSIESTRRRRGRRHKQRADPGPAGPDSPGAS